jgi:hypothetical protein
MVKRILPLLLLAGTAHADAPKWMWSMGTVLRSVSSDAHAAADAQMLDAYGWTTHDGPALGLRGDFAYLEAPLVDAGIAWTWTHDTFATGPTVDDPDSITGSSLEMGAMLRLHWVKTGSPIAAEPRVEAGLARTTVTLRGVADSQLDTYTRVGVDFRFGGRRAGALVTIDDTSVHANAMVPTGGITFGLSFYWREWTSR